MEEEPDKSAIEEQPGKETVRLLGVSDKPSSWLMEGSPIFGRLWGGCFLFATSD